MKSLIAAAFVAGALVACRPGSGQSGRGSAAGEDANRRHIRCDRFQCATLSPALPSPLRLARITGPITTDDPPTIGHILIIRRRRSPSASGLDRPGGEASSETCSVFRAFIFAASAFMTRSVDVSNVMNGTAKLDATRPAATRARRRRSGSVHRWRYPMPDAALSAVWALRLRLCLRWLRHNSALRHCHLQVPARLRLRSMQPMG